MRLLSIPSPGTNIWYLGPFPLRAYALCIIAGIIVGMVIATRRWQARGGTADSLEMVIVVAVPCGIVGARIYHVITDYQLYFGPGRHPIDALKIWQGGLGIWGAIALAALGAYVHPMTPQQVTAFAEEQQRTWRPVAEKVAAEMQQAK